MDCNIENCMWNVNLNMFNSFSKYVSAKVIKETQAMIARVHNQCIYSTKSEERLHRVESMRTFIEISCYIEQRAFQLFIALGKHA